MIVFHLFIISTFPLAVPLEWNVLFAYTTAFLFLGFPSWHGYAVTDMSPAWLALLIAAALVFYPILGNFRPDKVSFLPSMRQYAGNWASAVWAFAPGAEAKLDRVTRSAHEPGRPIHRVRLRTGLGGDHHAAPGGVAHHAQPGPRTVLGAAEEPAGRGHPLGAGGRIRLQLLDRLQLRRRPSTRRGHDRRGADARPDSNPASSIVVWVESQAWGSKVQHYQVIDGALGVVERGTWNVDDAVAEQPWLPNGPIPLNVTWQAARPHVGTRRPPEPAPPPRTRRPGMSTATVVGPDPTGWPPPLSSPRPG